MGLLDPPSKKAWYKIDSDVYTKIMVKHPEMSRAQAMKHYYKLMLPLNRCCMEIAAQCGIDREKLRSSQPEVNSDQPDINEFQNLIHDIIDERMMECNKYKYYI